MQLHTMMFSDAQAAVAALEAVGARYEPRLDVATDLPAVGRIQRRFGILRYPTASTVTDRAILDPFATAIESPENAKLAAQKLEYCPANKRLLVQIRDPLRARRLHPPWTLRPMNMDFMSVAAKANRAKPFGFGTFYSEHVTLGAGPTPVVNVFQLFSFPLTGSPDQTLLEPDRDDELDAAVGVILEADVLAG